MSDVDRPLNCCGSSEGHLPTCETVVPDSHLLSEDHGDIAIIPDAQRDVWLTEEQKRQPGIPDFSRVRKP